jgi:hypothetical protein
MAAKKQTLTGTVICVREHECSGFGTVPEGSLWDADHDVVKAKPAAFEQVLEPEDTEETPEV